MVRRMTSALATTKVFCTMTSSGITMSVNSNSSVINTITLNGLPIKLLNWFLNRSRLIGGRVHPFFAILQPPCRVRYSGSCYALSRSCFRMVYTS